ncbi:M48 family metallopeptidase [Yoonia sp. 2307UL14-13]|uniref:M48 family metallopeptidase n=1 Tax=Yoonia sp. 2307UL14-13 TaxID=3126506 RepID=UPI0030A7701C
MKIADYISTAPALSALTMITLPTILLAIAHFVGPYVPQFPHWIGEYACQNEITQQIAARECRNNLPSAALKLSAVTTIALAAMFMLIIWIASRIAGIRATLLSVIFPACIRLSLLFSPFLVAMNYTSLVLVLLTVLSWPLTALPYGETIENVGLIGLGLLGVLMVLNALLAAFPERGPQEWMKTDTVSLTWENAPELWQTVKDISVKMGVRTPRQVITGWDIGAWIAEQPLYSQVEDKSFNGPTLYLSLPLLRILTKAELQAVIAHEMAHYSGGDLEAKKEFNRAYERLFSAIITVQDMSDDVKDENKSETIASIALLSHEQAQRHLLNTFSRNMAAMNRRAELIADKTAADLMSADALAAVLVKLSIFDRVWGMVAAEYVKRVDKGWLDKIDISVVYAEAVNMFTRSAAATAATKVIGKNKVEHPFDTHPPTLQRLKNIGIKLKQLDLEELLTVSAENTAHHLIADPADIANALDPLPNRPDTPPAAPRADVTSAMASALQPLIDLADQPGIRITEAANSLSSWQEDFDLFELLGVLSGRLPKRDMINALEILKRRLTKRQRTNLLKTMKALAKLGKPRDHAAQKALMRQLQDNLARS